MHLQDFRLQHQWDPTETLSVHCWFSAWWILAVRLWEINTREGSQLKCQDSFFMSNYWQSFCSLSSTTSSSSSFTPSSTINLLQSSLSVCTSIFMHTCLLRPHRTLPTFSALPNGQLQQSYSIFSKSHDSEDTRVHSWLLDFSRLIAFKLWISEISCRGGTSDQLGSVKYTVAFPSPPGPNRTLRFAGGPSIIPHLWRELFYLLSEIAATL